MTDPTFIRVVRVTEIAVVATIVIFGEILTGAVGTKHHFAFLVHRNADEFRSGIGLSNRKF